MNERQLEFAVFCIENVAIRLGELPEKVYAQLRSSRILDYIIKSYDILHTQSKNYIIEDIISLMKEKGIPTC